MNLFLIGYRCTGKTSVGRSLAKRLGRPFLDADSELVKEQDLNISEIVNKQGWNVFREIESDIIKRFCELDEHVLATGGGSVLNEKNVKHMKRSGMLVWLKATPETIKERILQDKKSKDFRPSLTSKGSIEEIHETLINRNPYYEKAMDFDVDTDDISVDEVCNAIIKKLNDDRYKLQVQGFDNRK
jgi:shikimate kinase